MAKKSATTLQKEEQFLKDVKEYQKILKHNTYSFKPRVFKLKDAAPDVLARRVKLTALQTAYLLNVKQRCLKMWTWKPNAIETAYITGIHNAFMKYSVKLADMKVILSFVSSYEAKLSTGAGDFKYQGGPPTPLQAITSSVLVHDAVAMTFPDEKGHAIMYLHKKSDWGRKIMKDQSVEYDGLNHDALPGLKDWKVLARYITEAKKVQRASVCAIVRAICATESQQEFKNMAKAAN